MRRLVTYPLWFKSRKLQEGAQWRQKYTLIEKSFIKNKVSIEGASDTRHLNQCRIVPFTNRKTKLCANDTLKVAWKNVNLLYHATNSPEP